MLSPGALSENCFCCRQSTPSGKMAMATASLSSLSSMPSLVSVAAPRIPLSAMPQLPSPYNDNTASRSCDFTKVTWHPGGQHDLEEVCWIAGSHVTKITYACSLLYFGPVWQLIFSLIEIMYTLNFFYWIVNLCAMWKEVGWFKCVFMCSCFYYLFILVMQMNKWMTLLGISCWCSFKKLS